MVPVVSRVEPEDEPRGGILGFVKWYAQNRFHHMEQYLPELEQEPSQVDAKRVRERFLKATRHAKRVMVARLVVTALLALGIVATAVAAVANAVAVPAALSTDVDRLRDWLARAAAVSGSATLLLLLLRLAFDRYLRLIETSALLLAMQLSAARAAPPDASVAA